MDTPAESAEGVGTAADAGAVPREGIKVASRGGMGGYTRITASAVQWVEVGDTMPGQPLYDTVVPFLLSRTTATDITIVGGRTFSVTLPITAVPDVTNGVFLAQVRADTPEGVLLAQMTVEVVDATHLTFSLNAAETQLALVRGFRHGVWDAEIRLNGVETTIVPMSKVALIQGVSQGNSFYPTTSLSEAQAFDAAVLIA